MSSSNEAKGMFNNLILLCCAVSTIYFSYKFYPNTLARLSELDYSALIPVFLIFIAHLLVAIFVVTRFRNMSKAMSTDSEILTPKQVYREQARAKNDYFHVRPSGLFNFFNKFYKDTSGVRISDSLKVSTKKTYESGVIYGATGTGKGVNFFLPILQGELDDVSLVITDPKQELFEKSQGYLLEKGFNVLQLNLTNPEDSIHYNMLENCKSHDDVKELSEVITENADQQWANLSNSLMLSILYHVYDCEAEKSMSLVYKFLSYSQEDLEKIIEESESEKAKIQYRMFKQGQAAEGMIASIYGTLTASLGIYDSEAVKKVSTHSDISADDFRLRKTALFITYEEHKSATYAPFIAPLFYSIMGSIKNHDSVDESKSGGQEGLGTLFLLDEFANIGKIKSFAGLLTTVRSKKMGFFIGVQSENQIKTLYGDDAQTILSNLKTQIFLHGATGTTAERAFDLAGKKKVEETSYSKSSSGTSTSTSTREVDVVTKDKIRLLRSYEVFVVVENLRPILDLRFYSYMNTSEAKLFSKLPFSEKMSKDISKYIFQKLNGNKEKQKELKRNELVKKRKQKMNQRRVKTHSIEKEISSGQLEKRFVPKEVTNDEIKNLQQLLKGANKER